MVTNLEIRDLDAAKFLTSVDFSLLTQVRGHIFVSDCVPFLKATYSKILRIFMESATSAVSFSITYENSVLFSCRGRGCGRNRRRDSRRCYGRGEAMVVVVGT